MAKKKAKPLERDQRPEFLAALDALPEGEVEQAAYARRAMALFNDAVYVADEAQAAAAVLMFEAAVYRMNGDTFFGCAADDGSQKRLFAELAAVPGQVPGWGQRGQYLLSVDSVQMLVTVKPNSLGGVIYVDLDALNLDAPFVSSTGFRNVMLWPDSCMGQTFAQAVRAQVDAVLVEQGGAVLIGPDESCRKTPRKPPAWVAAALAAVAGNGQMAMFAEEPGAPVKVPLSGAERQKRRRRKLKELKEAEGLRPVMLNLQDLAYLWCAVDVFETVRADQGGLKMPDVRARLSKIFKGAPWLEKSGLDSLGADAGVLIEARHKEKEAARAWDHARTLERQLSELRAQFSKQSDRYRASVQREIEDENALLIVERDKAFKRVEMLQRRLIDAGLSADFKE